NYIIKLRVKNPDKEKLSQIKNEGVLILTRLQCYGGWDYVLTVLTKEASSILDFISSLYDSWKNDFLDYEIFEPIEVQFFPLKIFGLNTKEDKSILYETKRENIDELDKKIINHIAKNARIKIVDLAEIVDEKVETVNYRLKKLENNIISGYRIFLDLNKINFKLAQVRLRLSNLSKLNKSKILDYGNKREKIHAVSIGVGKYNTLFQIIYESPSELIEEINSIKQNFSESLLEYELIHIEDELMPMTI
ncbi:MAG: winged helix-turn-helix transcriptional regulator, partial [Nanoarchaeota archaeon]|nr:winged helix-turn-helix transcriptional regulator [Nanoarchaeota archaeon]